ncbi:50S ribosomal protein L30, variant 2 [Balamuthia mandrillaris]
MLRPIVGSSSRPAVGSSLLWRGDRWGVASLLPCRPAHALSRLPYARHCTTSTTSSNAREEVKQPTVEQRQAASSAAPPSLKDVKPSRPQRRFHSRVIAVRLVKSYQHQRPAVRRTVEALGINRMHQIVYHKNIAPIRGQLNKIKHLITITPVPEPADYGLASPLSPPLSFILTVVLYAMQTTKRPACAGAGSSRDGPTMGPIQHDLHRHECLCASSGFSCPAQCSPP